MVITHNPLGEYGHIHHRITSQIVSLQASNENLYYFGKYYKRKKVPAHLNEITDKDEKEKKKTYKYLCFTKESDEAFKSYDEI